MPAQPFLMPFSRATPYEQEEPGVALFKWLLSKDQVPGLCIGLVTLVGPIHKTAARHDWDQIYLILRGSGVVHLNSEHAEFSGEAIVVIPTGTFHSVEVPPGEVVQYAYVNQYRCR